METPVVSFIVPVYNAEEKLGRCIKSILSQTCESWELILIDDGSSDTSREICDAFASGDTRIRVLHKSNGGVGSARNEGIKNAKGKYISFVDADDYISNRFLDSCLPENEADLVICGFEMPEGVKKIFEDEIVDLKSENFKVAQLIGNPYFLDTPWGKLFKKSIIDNSGLLFDQQIRLSEDTLFCYQYLVMCTSVVIKSDLLYFYDGVWGGDSKYVLKERELLYTSKLISDTLNLISSTFKTKIDIRYKGFHLSKLDGLFTNYTDVDAYLLYSYSHPNSRIGSFLGDERISPLTYGMLASFKYAREGGLNAVRSHFNNLNAFLTVPLEEIEFNSRKTRAFYRILKTFGPSICAPLLYWILKR